MTLVHFHLTDAEGSGLSGGVSLVPTRRVTVRDAIRLPVAQTVKLTAGEATVEVMPSTTQWVWRASELVAAGATRYVEVPDSAQTVEYAGLVDVDPATLDQSSETVAVSPGSRYRLDFWHAVGDGSAWRRVTATVTAGDAVVASTKTPIRADTQWYEVTLDFTAPKDCTAVTVTITENTWLRVDDVSLVEII
ncbi:hypothetical protein [Bifidobacterium pseudocatenulatum]|jgi:hypothetical protein|uniref:hypothetical protein n=1 Tax=Bifidobacterium pseudocatenulatum TaxID=28026 RepID=UPI001CB17C48|nr:hypothetical protein [Bifidobacterium pseudocatenulatum]CAG9071952.1 hypothetical protein BIFLH14_00438 [Bifidobacterium pseudocatenulatum]CAG9075002.1 hypothetical protein BIFLH13_01113 [Bifidobacterium pseudocatenulatum]